MTKNFTGKFWSFSFYLLFFAAAGVLFNFIALYFVSQGLSGSQIGLLMGIGSLIGLFAGPLWSGLADVSRRYRLIFSVAILGNVVMVFCFPFFHTFLGFFLLMVLQAIFGGPITSLTDHATISMLEDEKEQYGRIRLGGTLGYGLATVIAGAVLERYGLQWIFWIYCALLLIGLLIGWQMHFSQKLAEGTFLNGARELLNDRKWIFFLIIVFIAGVGNAVITSYLFIYLEKIGTSKFWMGMAIAISSGTEILALFFAGPLLKRLKARGLLTLGLVATAVRCMLYGVVDVPWLALTVQLLQALTFPILLVAGVSYADENAPPGMGATAQGIFTSAFMGFGFAAGGFLGGVLLEYIGVQGMFFAIGAMTLLAGLFFGVLERSAPAQQPA
jgi:PPP family 3-phenylpropionic acid transporter